MRNDADLTPQTRQIHLGNVVIINKNTALLRLIQPGQQFHQCAFSTAALAHHSNKTARLNRNRHTINLVRAFGTKAEFHIFKSHSTLNWWQCNLVGIIGTREFWILIDNVGEAFHRQLHLLVALVQR